MELNIKKEERSVENFGSVLHTIKQGKILTLGLALFLLVSSASMFYQIAILGNTFVYIQNKQEVPHIIIYGVILICFGLSIYFFVNILSPKKNILICEYGIKIGNEGFSYFDLREINIKRGNSIVVELKTKDRCHSIKMMMLTPTNEKLLEQIHLFL